MMPQTPAKKSDQLSLRDAHAYDVAHMTPPRGWTAICKAGPTTPRGRRRRAKKEGRA